MQASENMSLHADTAAKRSAPFPEEVAARLARMKAARDRLPRPDAAGRRIAMPEKSRAPLPIRAGGCHL